MKSKYTRTSKWCLYTWCRYDATRDLIPKVAYTASCWTCSDASRSATLFQPPTRQGGRGMSVPKPRHWQGEPFHPSSSVITHDKSQFLFVFGKLPVVLCIWYLQCTLFFSTVGVHLCKRQSVNSPRICTISYYQLFLFVYVIIIAWFVVIFGINTTSGIYAKYHVKFMLLIVYTTTWEIHSSNAMCLFSSSCFAS